MIYFHKQLNMLGVDVEYLRLLLQDKMVEYCMKEIQSTGIPIEDFLNNTNLNKISNERLLKNIKNNKEFIEFFVAVNLCSVFYSKNSKIFFYLKDSIKKDKIDIKSIEDLKKIIKEKTLTDFAIQNKDGLRQFQLKQYKGELKTETFFDFLEKKLLNYGNQLGDVNLLILLQGTGQFMPQFIDYKKIHNKLLEKKLKFNGEILIMYNDQNRKHVINQVFPNLLYMGRKIDQETLDGWITNNN